MSMSSAPASWAESEPESSAPVLRLMYSSIAASDLDEAQMDILLDICRAMNSRDGLTGILVHLHAPQSGRAFFVQVLEGTQHAVEQAYARILSDERHEHVTLLSTSVTTERQYGAWSMTLRVLDAQQTESLRHSISDDPTTSTPAMSLEQWITLPVAMELLVAEVA